MERTTWTDERLEDLNARVDRNLDLVLEEIRLMRAEMHAEFRAIRGDMAAMRGDMAAMQRQVAQIGWALAGTLLAAMTALVVSLT
jgi:hypothetical protein